ncbi:MAG: DPP IV N-terminal domain-containing protein [Verrucomicrobiales bacterium]|nr:DPP IV N-terminal domain-containing protein [Verrucomicrobiales bacterium]
MTPKFFAAAVSLLAAAITHPDVRGAESTDSLLERITPRLRAIYEQGEFRVKRFPGEWLPDSSGYRVMESDRESRKRVPVFYDAATGDRKVMEPGERNETHQAGELSPDGKSVLVREKGNLAVRDLKSGTTVVLTAEEQGSAVSSGRAIWSPDSKRIMYVQTDSSKVRLRPMLIPGDPTYPKVKEMRFARVGGEIPALKVGVADAALGETKWLSLPGSEEGFYLGQVDWAGNSGEVLVEKLSRFRNEREFFLFDVTSGKRTRIFHESDPAWVVASIAKNAGLDWIHEGQSFLVLSEKDGWRHAYVYSRDGKKETLLTPGDYDIIEKVKIDEERGWLYFNASPDNGTQKYLYRVSLNGPEKPVRVTPSGQPGFHDYDFSPDGQWAFHTWSSFDTPPVTELVQFPDHRSVRQLEDNRKLKEKMASLATQSTEFLQLDIGDGVVMDAWMIKPSTFDPQKKYPVLVYVYGEPHAQTVLDRWSNSSSDYHRAVAELGYLIVSIDNRGTPAPKGAAWRREVFGSLGPLSTEEQAAGLKEMARTRSYIDLSRVGIWGWSGGGSNTLNAMFRKPDTYHVGIAVVPKPQPHLYNAWFQEIYMETRETNPEGYQKAAAINYADGLKGNLLIIHGSGETNTHLQIVEGLVDRLIELGKPFDFMAYPNRNHGISEGKGTSLHMRLHMVRYLLTHLRPGPE